MPKKTTRPTEVLLLGVKHTIEYIENKSESDHSDKEYGETDTQDHHIKIFLSSHKSEEAIQSTLLHEYVHGILGVSGLGYLLDEKLEEAIVVAIENGLKGVVKIIPPKPDSKK